MVSGWGGGKADKTATIKVPGVFIEAPDFRKTELQWSKEPESADDIIILYASDAPEVIIIIYVYCVSEFKHNERDV